MLVNSYAKLSLTVYIRIGTDAFLQDLSLATNQSSQQYSE